MQVTFAQEEEFVQQLCSSITVDKSIAQDLQALCTQKNHTPQQIMSSADIPLFRAYPNLRGKIPYINLGSLPTPIQSCPTLAQQLNLKNLHIKCDNKSGKRLHDGSQLFGGNKVRKLEFILADALAKDVDTVMILGCVGSNTAATTAVYAQQCGLECLVMFESQPGNSLITQRNLLLDYFYGAHMVHSPTEQLRSIATIHHFVAHKEATGKFPYVIPIGASCPLGEIGFVNAAFELKEQIDAGLLPEPDEIYVALGSAGTTAGLLLGIAATQLKSKIHAIAIEPAEPGYFAQRIQHLCEQTNQLLHNVDAHFPLIPYTNKNIVIDECFCGQDYSIFTPEGVAAAELMYKTEDIILDGVYTGKVGAALLADAANGDLNNKNILFWNTFCADRYEMITHTLDYHHLPKAFHRYFEEPVQEDHYLEPR